MEKKGKDVGELFLVRLNREDLEKLGYDTNTLQEYEYADVFLLWEDDNFSIKFVWHGAETQTNIETVRDTPQWIFHYIVDKYIES